MKVIQSIVIIQITYSNSVNIHHIFPSEFAFVQLIKLWRTFLVSNCLVEDLGELYERSIVCLRFGKVIPLNLS